MTPLWELNFIFIKASTADAVPALPVLSASVSFERESGCSGTVGYVVDVAL